jgi:hypothetical protein
MQTLSDRRGPEASRNMAMHAATGAAGRWLHGARARLVLLRPSLCRLD